MFLYMFLRLMAKLFWSLTSNAKLNPLPVDDESREQIAISKPSPGPLTVQWWLQFYTETSQSGPLHFAGKVTFSSPEIVGSAQGRSQTLNPGWARKQHFLNFSSILLDFLSSFLNFSSSIWGSGWAGRPPGKALATPLKCSATNIGQIAIHLFILEMQKRLCDGCVISNLLWPVIAAQWSPLLLELQCICSSNSDHHCY